MVKKFFDTLGRPGKHERRMVVRNGTRRIVLRKELAKTKEIFLPNICPGSEVYYSTPGIGVVGASSSSNVVGGR